MSDSTSRMSSATRALLIAKSSEVFSPAAPINRRDLFSGRLLQLQRVFDAINTRGQHAVIFGERGVGKTSLANIVLDIASETWGETDKGFVVKVNCTQQDGYGTIWQKAFQEMEEEIETEQMTLSIRPSPIRERHSFAELLPENPSPHDIRKIAMAAGKSIFIFDEFDRLAQGHAEFADTIKTLSDSSTDCSIILVGVARDIDELVKEHASIDRSLVQILMPRMTAEELEEILEKAMAALQMNLDGEARQLIVLLSQGLPHYTHVIGKASTIVAISSSRWNISLEDVRAGIDTAIENTQQSIQSAYQEATTSPRSDTLFREVLLACALAEVDELGYFSSSSVREPLSKIMRKRYEIPNFSQHLDKFSSADRGNVLEKAGTSRRFRFRFSNPLLQPFVIMRGIADGLLTDDLLAVLRKPPSGSATGRSPGSRRSEN